MLDDYLDLKIHRNPVNQKIGLCNWPSVPHFKGDNCDGWIALPSTVKELMTLNELKELVSLEEQ